MCGITGLVGLTTDSPQARETVAAMVSSLVRRGPDSAGMEIWPEAILGHRRLAILDLSEAGHQPMVSEDREIGLVFNGCIYNFQEIRKELEAHGYRFRSHTDTEVLLHGYRHWGADALVQRLRGMFAFGIWDDRQRKLTLVRDRLGVKPLVYAAAKGRIAFASTITALRDGRFVEEIDPQAVLEFLEFGWVSDDLTIFAGARKVPAATIVEWQDGRIRERCYWRPPESGSRKISFDQAVEETEALFLEAVKLRLVADVPIGALLSGGIDSTLVAWAMAKLNANVKSFTVGAPGHPSDESADARRTARILGIPHEVIDLSSDDQPALDDLTCAYGEPFACSSALGMLQVCKAVKPKATVLLTGDGGDDVFLGYPHHRNFLYAQRLARLLPSSAARIWPSVRPAVARVPALRRAMHLTDYAVGGLGAVTRTHDGLPYYEHAGILGERLVAHNLKHRAIALSFDSARNLMEEFLEYERRTRFVAEYMTKVDGGAMYYSIEARSPFLDHVLWEHAASLPIEMRLRGGGLKPVLRALVRRNVGAEVADRKKQGFTVPVWNWLIQGWRPQLDALSHDTLLEREGWIRPETISAAAAAAVSAGRAPVQLWALVVLENWLRANRMPVGAGISR
ncbi:MAG TPA: asparagine synthase (glutamine-hydrolyzing) [Bryobacteraceae bacterium]|nr:asparagine synthase (glutamine-hydrolyzing) [Bryobacteraceae bacterium]